MRPEAGGMVPQVQIRARVGDTLIVQRNATDIVVFSFGSERLLEEKLTV